MVRNRSCPAVSQICNYTQTLENAKTIESGVTYFDLFVVHSDRLHREVDSDGVSVPLLIQAGLESPNDAGFAHPTVTHQHYLEQKVEGLIPHDGRRVRTGDRCKLGCRFQNKKLKTPMSPILSGYWFEQMDRKPMS